MILGSFYFDPESQRLQVDYRSVVASYIGVPIYILLIVGYKLTVRSKHVGPKDADMWTGRSEIRLTRMDVGEVVEVQEQ